MNSISSKKQDEEHKRDFNLVDQPKPDNRKTSHSPYQIGRATVSNFKVNGLTHNLSSRNDQDSEKSIQGHVSFSKGGHGIDMMKL
jgi:hypothetical protein